MTRTHTTFFKFHRFAAADGASTVARIAMVCNDLALANSLLGQYNKPQSGPLSHIHRGARLYLVRMSCGHLVEGIAAIGDVKGHPGLRALVTKCHDRTQKAFASLCKCLPGGKDYPSFTRYVEPIRNKVGFHYDSQKVAWVLERFSKRQIPIAMTIGEDIHSSRFDFADDLLDFVVCRKLWQISKSKDVRAEANRIANWCFQRSVAFFDFGEDFVYRFLREHAT